MAKIMLIMALVCRVQGQDALEFDQRGGSSGCCRLKLIFYPRLHCAANRFNRIF